MEETTVLIVGAGPSGLSLAVYLSRMGIKTVVLEKEREVTEDPRGIVIAGDAVRISYQMGIEDALVTKIGSDMGVLNFHYKTFRNPPFMNFDMTHDYLLQSVSNGIAQFQPNYERALRTELSNSSFCDLRVGCEVQSRSEEEEHVVVKYTDNDGNVRSIRASWFVAADGKRGIVRKKFLEPEGIVQEVGLYNHVSTWIAANFEITLPTPETHPKFPLWKFGYTPEDVYKVFWPSGFHFCNDPKRPAVSGRFGPEGAPLWRHEYCVEPGDDLDDSEAHLWQQFGPWLDVPGSSICKGLSHTVVTFPRDCVRVTRCRPFTFSTKVVNKWFCRRTLLVGDAAHVFPPFGGQGIACGIRDAQGLAWRLGLLSNINATPQVRERVLNGWATERREVVDRAALTTKVNGAVTNQRSFVKAFLFRTIMRILWYIPGVPQMMTKTAMGKTFQFKDCEDSFALQSRGGGWKIPQIWVQSGKSKPELSDAVFLRDVSHLALLVVVRGNEQLDEATMAGITSSFTIQEQNLVGKNVTYLSLGQAGGSTSNSNDFPQLYHTCSSYQLVAEGIKPVRGYDEKSLKRRIEKRTKYVIVRPDFCIHSMAANDRELVENIKEIRRYLGATLEN